MGIAASLEPNLASELGARLRNRSTVILGVGNSLRGDDGVGVWIVEELRKRGDEHGFHVYECGTVPENFVGPVRKLSSQQVLLVDCVDLGAEPGETALLTSDQVAEVGFSTHNFSLKTVMELLKIEAGCQVSLLAIQPESIEFGKGLSPKIKKRAQQLAQILIDCQTPGGR